MSSPVSTSSLVEVTGDPTDSNSHEIVRSWEFAVAVGLLGQEMSISGYGDLGRRVVHDLFEILPAEYRNKPTLLILAADIGKQEPPIQGQEDQTAYAAGAKREAVAVMEGITT